MIFCIIRRVWGPRGFCFDVWLMAAGQMTKSSTLGQNVFAIIGLLSLLEVVYSL